MKTIKDYHVEAFTTGLFSGTLSPKKLQDTLNHFGKQGCRLVRTIHERRRVLLFFSREVHFLIFEREATVSKAREMDE
jgi:hypothetical protein